ncbi:MAG: hypothetical protein AB7F89_08035 [Pirellulaceae bacterium]
MAQEVWLKSNWRVAAALGLVPTLIASVGTWMLWSSPAPVWRWLGIVLIGLAGLILGWLVWAARRPRLAYRDGELAVFLTGLRPIRVPIELVECFFLGQGPSLLPMPARGESGGPQTTTLIVRLAEAATEWHHRDVRVRCGHWCEGYITIRGTCCEPLSGEVVGRLNRRLVEAHRAARSR